MKSAGRSDPFRTFNEVTALFLSFGVVTAPFLSCGVPIVGRWAMSPWAASPTGVEPNTAITTAVIDRARGR